jgi:hypothetical protein
MGAAKRAGRGHHHTVDVQMAFHAKYHSYVTNVSLGPEAG